MFRWVGTALAVLIAVCAVAVTASWVLLVSVRPMIEKKFSTALGCEVHYGWAWVTPWASIVISDLHVVPPSDQPRLFVSRLILQYEWDDLISRRWNSVHQIMLQGPHLILTQSNPSKTVEGTMETSLPKGWVQPIRVFIEEGRISVPGLDSMLRGGSVDADFDGERLLIHRAHASVLGADLRAQGQLQNLSQRPNWKFDFQLDHPKFSGRLEVEGDAESSTLSGYSQLAEENRIPLSGHIKLVPHRIEMVDVQIGAFQATTALVDFLQQKWSFTFLGPAAKRITVRSRGNWKKPQCEVVVSDFPAGPLTISTTAQLTANLSENGRGLDGTATTVGSRVNQKSLGELSGAWFLTKDTLKLQSLALGTKYRITGTIGIAPPYPIQLILDITGVEVSDIATLIEPNKAPLASGSINGQLQLAGNLGDLQMKGYLTGRDGKIGRSPFEIAIINFEGKGSVIKFLDSRIQQGADQMMILEGDLDLSKLGTQSVFEQVRLIPFKQPPPVQNPPKEGESQVTVRRYLDSEIPSESVPHEEVEVGLKMLGTNGQKTKLKYRKQDEDKFMGVEHQVKF